jgi:hypothetical protein
MGDILNSKGSHGHNGLGPGCCQLKCTKLLFINLCTVRPATSVRSESRCALRQQNLQCIVITHAGIMS